MLAGGAVWRILEAITGGAKGQLAHDRAHLRFVAQQGADGPQVTAKRIAGRAVGRKRGTKPLHRVGDHAPDQGFLGWKVIVQRGDIHPNLGRHLAGAQPLETAFGDLVERGLDERLVAVFPMAVCGSHRGRTHASIKHLIES